MRRLRHRSILVIDDDADVLCLLEKVLSDAGATVTPADFAGDAVDILTARQKRIDLVITDLRMPFVNGLTVVFAIKQVYPSLPIIVLTAFGSPEIKAECLHQGAAAFLEKPFVNSELIAAIERVFNAQTTAARTPEIAPNDRN